ncbi:hypothetical protein HKD37_18G050603 [Glycine soja]
MRARNFDMYEFLEPQSIQRYGQSQFESESYMKSWMQNSKCDVYLGAYLNGSVLFFNTFALALLNNINILMFLVFNNALKGLDDTPQLKSKVGARWIVVKYFNDVRPLEAERLKVLRIQWAQYYLKVRIKHRMLGNYYFNDVRPLEAERLKALRIQWAQYYLKVRIKLMMLGKYVILVY